MNESTKRDRERYSEDKSDPLTKLLIRYSRWRRSRLVAESKLPFRLLLLRTAYFTSCVLVDGVLLPWTIVGLNRTAFAYAAFAVVIVLALSLQVWFYKRWKGTWSSRR